MAVKIEDMEEYVLTDPEDIMIAEYWKALAYQKRQKEKENERGDSEKGTP